MNSNAIPKAVLRRAITWLQEVARQEASMSQAPDLTEAKETQAWKDSKVLSAALRDAPRASRAAIVKATENDIY